MKIKQELLKGPRCVRVFSHSSPCCFVFLTLLFLLQELEKAPCKNDHLAILLQSIKTILIVYLQKCGGGFFRLWFIPSLAEQ